MFLDFASLEHDKVTHLIILSYHMTEMRIQTKQWSCLSEPTLHIAESMIAVLFF